MYKSEPESEILSHPERFFTSQGWIVAQYGSKCNYLLMIAFFGLIANNMKVAH